MMAMVCTGNGQNSGICGLDCGGIYVILGKMILAKNVKEFQRNMRFRN